MNEKEFSDKFDTLLNSYKTSVPYGYEQGNFDFTLNEYEKSIYLTQSQESLVRGYFTNSTDIDSTFEGSESARKSLETLVKDVELHNVDVAEHNHIVANSKFFIIPDDLWFTVYESVKYKTEGEGNIPDKKCTIDTITSYGNAYTNVMPITHDDFYRTYNNPFRGVTNKRALRLNAAGKLYEVVSKYDIDTYFIRYVKRPKPIILEDLPDGLTINNESTSNTCELDDSLHDVILSNAVQLALQYHTLTTGKVPVPQQQTSSKKSDDNND